MCCVSCVISELLQELHNASKQGGRFWRGKEWWGKENKLIKEDIQEDINQSTNRNARHRVRAKLALIQIPGDLHIVLSLLASCGVDLKH